MNEKEKYDETTSSNNETLRTKMPENEGEQTWGVLEELLLACAVNRHGTDSWDSIAKELQKRIKHSSSHNEDEYEKFDVNSGFSSKNCKEKYVHLKRRFHDEEDDDDGVLRMVEELRKLRVEELKREVHRHDVSIVSLQSKVKRLKEERENNSKVKEEQADLTIEPVENIREKLEEEFERSSQEKVITGDSAENRSWNESNSTSHHHHDVKTDTTQAVTEERESKLKRESDDPDPVQLEKKSFREGKVSRLTESLSESRRGESLKQQSSDVQSCASLSKKKRRRFGRGGGDNSTDEFEAEELSPANKRINAKSQPLIRFLEILRSHKHGSVFQRRIPSQETEKYRNVIRQHMDLDTVQSRLDKGIYSDCHPKFYRDLLLIFTNAVLFYRKSSAEHLAARELRRFVIDEITRKNPKPKIQPRKPDPDPQQLEPIVKKPRSTTMVVCRRRISGSIQALSDSLKKGDSNNVTNTSTNNFSKSNSSSKLENNGREEKIMHDNVQKKSNNGDNGDADGNLKKSNLVNGGLRLSNNNDKKIISKKLRDQKQEKNSSSSLLKKQGVANFLKRMKQNSPVSQEKMKNNEEDEEEKNSGNGNGKKTNGSGSGTHRRNVKEEAEVCVTRRSSGRKGDKESTDEASRRAIGRPPKRKAAMGSGAITVSSKGGRSGGGGRDGGEKVKKKPRR